MDTFVSVGAFPREQPPDQSGTDLAVPGLAPSHTPTGNPEMGPVLLGGPGGPQGAHGGEEICEGFVCQDQPSETLSFTRQPMRLLPCELQQ